MYAKFKEDTGTIFLSSLSYKASQYARTCTHTHRHTHTHTHCTLPLYSHYFCSIWRI